MTASWLIKPAASRIEHESSIGFMQEHPEHAQNHLNGFFAQVKENGLAIKHIDVSRLGFIAYIAEF